MADSYRLIKEKEKKKRKREEKKAKLGVFDGVIKDYDSNSIVYLQDVQR